MSEGVPSRRDQQKRARALMRKLDIKYNAAYRLVRNHDMEKEK